MITLEQANRLLLFRNYRKTKQTTPVGTGYTIAGFPNISGADYSAYNGLYSSTNQTANGKTVYQNASGKYLYRYHYRYEMDWGDGSEPEVYEGAGWCVANDLSLADISDDPSRIAYEAVASANDGASPDVAQYWSAGEYVYMEYTDAWWELHDDYPPELNITCT